LFALSHVSKQKKKKKKTSSTSVNTDEAENPTINPESQQKVFEVQHFCATRYTCRQQQLANYYSWDKDPVTCPCSVCDNCVSSINDDAQQLPDAVDDVCEMVNVIQSLTTHHENVTPQDVINVYTHAKTKDMEAKGYFMSEAYKRPHDRKVLKTKELASLALDKLVAERLVRKECVLKKQKERQLTCSAYIRGAAENVESLVRTKSWVYRVPRRKSKGKRKE
jgi:hypothetical protein